MNVYKLKSENVGSHFHEQAIIFTDKKEICVTKDEVTDDGFELVKFQTYDLEQITSIINHALKGLTIQSSVVVEMTNKSIFVSSVSKLYKVNNYNVGDLLENILGGYEGQIITIVGNGTSLTINNNGNLAINGTINLDNEYSILLLQKVGETWVELSRKING